MSSPYQHKPKPSACQHGIYGLSCEQYEQLWERSQGRCERCHLPFSPERRPQIDHDHDWLPSARAVRGLLCPPCNRMLSYVDQGRSVDNATQRFLDNAWWKTAELRPVTPYPDRHVHRQTIDPEWPKWLQRQISQERRATAERLGQLEAERVARLNALIAQRT